MSKTIAVRPCTEIPIAIPGVEPRATFAPDDWTDLDEKHAEFVARRVREGLLEVKPEAEPEKTDEDEPSDGLDEFKVAELRELAADMELEVDPRAKKEDLIAAIRAADEKEE